MANDHPDLSGEPGWEPLVLPPVLSDLKSFVSGDPEGDRFRVRYYYDPESGHVQARVWFGPRTAGPPGRAHGGSIAAVLDEAMGVAALYAGYIVVAGRLTVDFATMLPLQTVTTAEAWVERVEGPKIHTRAHLKQAGGETYATSTGLFVNIGFERFESLLNE